MNTIGPKLSSVKMSNMNLRNSNSKGNDRNEQPIGSSYITNNSANSSINNNDDNDLSTTSTNINNINIEQLISLMKHLETRLGSVETENVILKSKLESNTISTSEQLQSTNEQLEQANNTIMSLKQQLQQQPIMDNENNSNNNNNNDSNAILKRHSVNNNTQNMNVNYSDNSTDRDSSLNRTSSVMPILTTAESNTNVVKTESVRTNTQMKPKLPDTYSNERESSIEKWLYQMNNYLKLSDCDSSKKVAYASSYLKGEAEQWIRRVSEKSEINEWNDFVNQIKQRFILPDKVDRLMKSFDTIRQMSSVSAYINKFQEYAIELSGKYSEDVLIHKFNSNLNNRIGSQVDLRAVKSDTLEQAFAYALKIESSIMYRQTLTPIHLSSSNQNNNRFRTQSQSASKLTNNNNNKSRLSNNNSTGSKSNPISISNVETNNSSSDDDDGFVIRSASTSDEYGTSNDDTNSISSHQSNSSLNSIQSNRQSTNATYQQREQLKKEGKCFNCKRHGHISKHCQSKNVNAQML